MKKTEIAFICLLALTASAQTLSRNSSDHADQFKYKYVIPGGQWAFTIDSKNNLTIKVQDAIVDPVVLEDERARWQKDAGHMLVGVGYKPGDCFTLVHYADIEKIPCQSVKK